MKSLSKAALLLTVLAMVSCAPAAEEAVVEETPTTEADVAARDLMGEWTAAYNAADAGALAALYADNAVLMGEDGPAWIGSPAIRDGLAQFFEQGPGGQPSSRQSEDLVDEVMVSQDWLIARGNWREEITPQDGSDPWREVGKWMWLSQRQPDGSWKIAWHIYNRDPPSGQ